MQQFEKIPATVITGFLGAGKTTLIQHIIKNAEGRRIALIVNEFGDIGIDGDMLKACGNEDCGEEDIIELANGCICCTVAEDFIPTMEKLLKRDPAPDHIVIETSGLALPQPLVQAFNWPEIKTRVTVDGVVTVVDSDALAQGHFASDEQAVNDQRSADDMLDHHTPLGELFEDQLSCADLVLLNKSDLVSEEELARIEQRLEKEVQTGTRFTRSSEKSPVPVKVLIGLDSAAEDKGHKSHHDKAHDNDADHHHDHDAFVSLEISLGEIADVKQFVAGLSGVIEKNKVLRLKGFAAVQGKPMRLVIQAVGPRIDSYYDRLWKEGEQPATNLVVIGKAGMDLDQIKTSIMDAI